MIFVFSEDVLLMINETPTVLEYNAPFRDGSGAVATSKMERFVMIVNSFQSLAITTKHSILDVTVALGPPLPLNFLLKI